MHPLGGFFVHVAPCHRTGRDGSQQSMLTVSASTSFLFSFPRENLQILFCHTLHTKELEPFRKGNSRADAGDVDHSCP